MFKKLNFILDKHSQDSYVDIEKIIRKLGIDIDFFDFEEINGVTIGNKIGINKNISMAKQRFTLAHELCHYVLNEKGVSSGVFASLNPRELRADEFASKLLLPEKALIKAWDKYGNISYISQIFGVPKKVVRNRLINIQFKTTN